MTDELSFKPLKRNLWTDFEELFGSEWRLRRLLVHVLEATRQGI